MEMDWDFTGDEDFGLAKSFGSTESMHAFAPQL
jgi:hypothetical protein